MHWLLRRVRLREGFRRAEEDAILDVLDGLAGWCHESAALEGVKEADRQGW